MNFSHVTLFVATWLLTLGAAIGQEKVDYDVVDRIRDEGFNRSRVMELASWMTDVYGPRFANTLTYDQAAKWAKQKFEEFGVGKVEIEAWGKLGPRWENSYTSAHMLSPVYMPMIAYPVPFTRGTKGKVKAQVVSINTREVVSIAELESYRGKVAGKVVFVAPSRTLRPSFSPDAVRLSDEELNDMASLHIIPQQQLLNVPREEIERLKEGVVGGEPLSDKEIYQFFDKEGAEVLVFPGEAKGIGPMDKGTVLVDDAGPIEGEFRPMAALILAPEHYNRVMRIIEKDLDVEMEVEIRNIFQEDDQEDYNVIAEIAGTDLDHEIVMLGGHFDGKSAGTSATDNAAGAAAVMEAVRILKVIGVQPRRTIRAALWGAEEHGLRGSRGYVKKHFEGRETKSRFSEYENFSVYFNMDWYGRFRGVYLQGNDRARPIFHEWMKPFHDVGMTHLAPGNTGGSDHMAFHEIGLPGFQFIQDDLEFFTTTFHTNMDVYDRLVPEDLMQAAVILASFTYHAAMRDGKFPRSRRIENKRRWHKD